MKRVVIAIVLATVFAGVAVFAESRDAAARTFGAGATLVNAPTPASPQFRRRHRPRRFVRRRRIHQRRLYVNRRRGRRRR